MFHHVLVPLDGSSLAECVLERATSLAKAFGARVSFLRVLEEPELGCARPIDPLEWNMCKVEVRSYLEGLTQRFREAGLEADYAVLEGQPPLRIMEFIQSQKVDLLILSSHGKTGLSGWNGGSVFNKMLFRPRVSTLIVRAYAPAAQHAGKFRRLLVPLDGSARAECVLSPLATIARIHDADVLFIHVVRRPEMPRRTPLADEDMRLSNQVVERNQQEARRYFEQLQPRLPGKSQVRLLVDEEASYPLHDLAREEDIDLIVMSAHGQSGKTRWPYGAVASSFILYGNVPTLVVQDLRPEELELSQAEISVKQRKGH